MVSSLPRLISVRMGAARITNNYVHKKYRAMDRHVMGFGKYNLSFYVVQPLGTWPLGFSKRPLRVRVSEFA
jgi:hypothetical protein